MNAIRLVSSARLITKTITMKHYRKGVVCSDRNQGLHLHWIQLFLALNFQSKVGVVALRRSTHGSRLPQHGFVVGNASSKVLLACPHRLVQCEC